MPIDADDLARTALADLIPRCRYRTAGRTDERFASFAPGCVRVAFQHLGANPSLLLFCGPGQDPVAAARLAATWAGASWRPSAVQRRVLPGVLAVHVAPGGALARPGPVEGAAVPAVVWTVDADSGRIEAPPGLRGGPPAGPIRRAAARLAAGQPAVPVGVLDHAERSVMQVRRGMSITGVPSVVGLVLMLLALRLGFTVFGDVVAGAWLALPRDGVLLAGVIGAAALAFDYGGLRGRVPGFSSTRRWVPMLSWVGYVAAVLVTAFLVGLIPQALVAVLAGNHG
jgi:hypothetical protein